jgi:hypothetical protein
MIFGWIRDMYYVCPSINATKMRTKDGKRIDRKNCCQHDNMRDIWLQSAHTSKGKKNDIIHREGINNESFEGPVETRQSNNIMF